MRRILIIGIFAAYSHISNAQETAEFVSTTVDTTVNSNNKTTSIEDRLNKQEAEIQALKKNHVLLKKQLTKIQTALPNARRTFTISRTGSKQFIVE